MALRIGPELKQTMRYLVELISQMYRPHPVHNLDQHVEFYLLLAFSSEGLAEGAVDNNGKPIWVASHDLVLGCKKIKRVSSGVVADAGLDDGSSGADIHRNNELSENELSEPYDREAAAEMIVGVFRSYADPERPFEHSSCQKNRVAPVETPTAGVNSTFQY
jgi:hypothetical protein